jgi:protein tyrosine/serine phosphatase
VQWLKQLGIKTVINLRHFHGESEGDLVRAAGMRYERVPLHSSEAPSAKEVEQFMKLVSDPSLRPIYVHCQFGVDRTGTMMAVYRIERDNWSNADALAEMIYFGAHSMWKSLQKFVQGYVPTKKWPKAG